MKNRNILKCVKCGRKIATNGIASEKRCYICDGEMIFIKKESEEYKNESL